MGNLSDAGTDILEIKSVSKSYDQDPIIKDVSFVLKKGEILALIGKSGSGKTTLIKILAGLIQPDEGEVMFQGEKLEGPDEKLVPGYEEIKLVHQDFKLYHRMTVEENLNNALLGYVETYKKERIPELLSLCHLKPVRNQYVDQLSGGEKQRVAIALALATEPKVLLFDEPFSNLDFNTKSAILQDIEQIARETKTSVLLITHDSRDAMEIADRLMVFEDGHIIRSGIPTSVYANPKLATVANLLGLYTAVSYAQLKKISKNETSDNGQYGIWAEDVLLHRPDGFQSRVKKVIFCGGFNKLRLAAEGVELWAYDYSRKIKARDKVKFELRIEKVFPIS